jgi:hypothetical protein
MQDSPNSAIELRTVIFAAPVMREVAAMELSSMRDIRIAALLR